MLLKLKTLKACASRRKSKQEQHISKSKVHVQQYAKVPVTS